MRQQGQQNRRGRARGGRKIQNPLSRNYDSNGPDVKIRGTAAHIAEKYTSLARDALSSGDTVAAENLFQHAEHYNRIIMAAQNPAGSEAQPVVNDQANGATAASSEEGSEIQFDLQDASASDGDRKSEKNGRSKNGRSSNGAGNNRRRRKRPNGNGGQQMKNGAESNDNQSEKSTPPVREAKSEKAPEVSEQSANGALL